MSFNKYNINTNLNKIKVIAIILFVIVCQSNIFGKVTSVDDWDKIFQEMDYKQRSALVKTFVRGLPLGLQYPLTAIHIKESFGDKYKLNINTKNSIDVGSFMINSYWYLKYTNREVNSWNTARAIEELSNYELNLKEAIRILKQGLLIHNNNYRKAYEYYNGGREVSRVNKEYAQDIINIQEMLRRYFVK